MTGFGAFVELARSTHDRESFTCGEPELDHFIRKQALRHMQAGISRTMVLPAAKPMPDGKYPICAFYTIAPGSIARETLPDLLAKKLPGYPVPVFLLAQLAVHESHKGQGLGKVALIRALNHLYDINAHMRAYAVIVDCLNENIAAFYEQFGFKGLSRKEGRERLFLPMKTVKRLFEEG